MDEKRTQFDYLLNAFERASQSDRPADLDYAGKRRALYAYVRDLEKRAAPPPAADAVDVLLMALAYVRWEAFGECRTDGWNGPPPTARETADAIAAALAARGK